MTQHTDWHDYLPLDDNGRPWEPPARRTFPPKERPPEPYQITIAAAHLPGGSVSYRATRHIVDRSGTLAVFADGRMRACFASGFWQSLETSKEGDDAEATTSA